MRTVQQSDQLARKRVKRVAGWWAFDPEIGPGMSWKSKLGYTGEFLNGDQPADIMDRAIKDIEEAYEGSYGIGRPPKPEEMQAFLISASAVGKASMGTNEYRKR